jgi:hypothetical protein
MVATVAGGQRWVYGTIENDAFRRHAITVAPQ